MVGEEEGEEGEEVKVVEEEEEEEVKVAEEKEQEEEDYSEVRLAPDVGFSNRVDCFCGNAKITQLDLPTLVDQDIGWLHI